MNLSTPRKVHRTRMLSRFVLPTSNKVHIPTSFVDRKRTSSSVWPSPIGKCVLFCRVTCTQSLALHPICFLSLQGMNVEQSFHCNTNTGPSHGPGRCATGSTPRLLMLPHLFQTPENFLHLPPLSDTELGALRWMPSIGRGRRTFESPLVCSGRKPVIQWYSLIVCRFLRVYAHTLEDPVPSFVLPAYASFVQIEGYHYPAAK